MLTVSTTLNGQRPMLADLDIIAAWDWREPIPFFEAEDYEVAWEDQSTRFLKRNIWFCCFPFFVVRVEILKKVNIE